MLEESAKILTGFVAGPLRRWRRFRGRAGEMETLVLGVEGDILEQLAAQLGLDGESLSTVGVESCGAFFPAPLAGDFGNPAASRVQFANWLHAPDCGAGAR